MNNVLDECPYTTTGEPEVFTFEPNPFDFADNKDVTFKDWLDWLHPDGGPVNVCWKRGGRNLTGRVVPNNEVASEGITVEGEHADAVWVNVNKPLPDASAPTGKFKADDMERYQFLALDIDRDKNDEPKKSATAPEHEKTLGVARKIMASLKDDLPQPALLDTGNGHLLLYPIDLPNTVGNKELIKKVVTAIATNNDEIKFVDSAVCNPDRIFGVPGTWNRGKEQGEERPHRLRKIVGDLPDRQPMLEADFIRWATDYIGVGEDLTTPSPERQVGPPERSNPPVEPEAVSDARAYLSRCNPSIEGQRGDPHAFNIAGHLLAFGLGVEEVHALMLYSDWNRQSSPPWSSTELMVKVRSANKNGTPRELKTPRIGNSDIDDYFERKQTTEMPIVGETPAIMRRNDRVVKTVPLSQMRAKRIDWLWDGKIPIGKVTLFSGPGGTNKSTVAYDLATRVSVGGDEPQGSTKMPLGDVLLIAGDDEPEYDIIPRLEVMGADLTRVSVIDIHEEKNGKRIQRAFTLENLGDLEAALRESGTVKLVVIDPVSSHVGNKNTDKHSDVYSMVAPLNNLAARYQTSIILVHHPRKNQGGGKTTFRDSVNGSAAWTDASRSAWAFKRVDKTKRMMMQGKANSKESPAMLFNVVAVPHDIAGEAIKIEWTGTMEGTADELMNEQPLNMVTDAETFILDYLANGTVKSKNIETEIKAAGFSFATLRRARTSLQDKRKIKCDRKGFGPEATYWWSLIADEGGDEGGDVEGGEERPF